MMRIVLASKSPRRSDILKSIGLDFEAADSKLNESYDSSMSPEDVVRYLAYNKAKNVADCIEGQALVIGADTIVVLEGKIMGKPLNANDAFNMLRRLSGKEHSVLTGLCVIESPSGKDCVDSEITTVKIKELSDDEIWSYIKSGEPFDKAGAYAIQGIGSLIVEGISGDYFNVVGLPVFKLSCMLRNFGLDLLMR